MSEGREKPSSARRGVRDLEWLPRNHGRAALCNAVQPYSQLGYPSPWEYILSQPATFPASQGQLQMSRVRKQPSIDFKSYLPSAGWRTAWGAGSRAAVVIAIRSGTLSRVEAFERYMLSEEELSAWEEAFDAGEPNGEPGDATPEPEVDGQPDGGKSQTRESTYRNYRRRIGARLRRITYYRRRIGEHLRLITDEQHLAYGTWILALGTLILAYLAYCALRSSQDALAEGQRAWVGPVSAGIDGSLTRNEPLKVVINYSNSGKEPGRDLFYNAAPFLVTTTEDKAGVTRQRVAEYIMNCKRTSPTLGANTVFPTSGLSGYQARGQIDKTDVDWEVIYGVKIVVVPGCFVYRTLNEIHRSAFCFFSQNGTTALNSWSFCPFGNYAD
jgi:hypothetical protein